MKKIALALLLSACGPDSAPKQDNGGQAPCLAMT